MREVTQTEEKLHDFFRDSLLIDKFDPQLENRYKRRFDQAQSECGVDAIVWNVFRTFNQIDRKLWVEQLFYKAFQEEFPFTTDQLEIKLWKKIHPPKSLPFKEGKSEIDIVIETEDFVWFIEAKYRSDITFGTEQNAKRDQIIRNIDIGTNYARKRNFYFSLIILDKYHSPIGYRRAVEYKDSLEAVQNALPHRVELPSLKGISVIQWKDIQSLFKTIYLYSKNKYEKYIADQVSYWLLDKIREDNH